jgi:hypothetical protein
MKKVLDKGEAITGPWVTGIAVPCPTALLVIETEAIFPAADGTWLMAARPYVDAQFGHDGRPTAVGQTSQVIHVEGGRTAHG